MHLSAPVPAAAYHRPMLKNIPALLSPDTLHALASMGHGDEVAIVDANFPAARIASQGGARLVRVPGATSTDMLGAVLSVLPLDDFELQRAWTMEVVGDAQAVPLPVAEFRAMLAQGGEAPPAPLERMAFYERSRSAFAVIQCGDKRKYANILLRKGVVATE